MTPDFKDATKMLRRAFKDDVNWLALRKNICARRYESPAGYIVHERAVDALSAAIVCFALERGVREEPGFHEANLYAACCGLPESRGRSYWINQDLASSLIRTDLPDDISLSELNIPISTFVLFVPTEVFKPGFLVISYGEPITYQFPGVFPVPGSATQKALYPTVGFKKSETASRVIRCGTVWDDATWGARWKDDQPLSTMLPGENVQGSPEDLDTLRQMANLAVNALVWMNSHHESVSVIEGTPKGKPGKGQFSWSPTWLGAGYRSRRAVGIGVTGGDGRLMPSHWRRGHLRSFWYGPRTETSLGTGRRVHWIEPIWINPDVSA